MYSDRYPRPMGQDWLRQVFSCNAVRSGGVIKRAIGDVDREVGRAALELEVRRRGFRMVRTQTHFLIICSPGGIEVVC